jgi:hypothetical protein
VAGAISLIEFENMRRRRLAYSFSIATFASGLILAIVLHEAQPWTLAVLAAVAVNPVVTAVVYWRDPQSPFVPLSGDDHDDD